MNMQKQFCSDQEVDTNTCICLVFHGDRAPYAKGAHKQVSIEVYSWHLLCEKDGKKYLLCSFEVSICAIVVVMAKHTLG